jgi:hypothetical protein
MSFNPVSPVFDESFWTNGEEAMWVPGAMAVKKHC